MTPDQEEAIRGALAFQERSGAHRPATAAAAYVEHVPILLDEIDRMRDVLRRLVTAPAGISTIQFYANGKVQLILTPEGGDALSEARHLLGH